MPYATPLETKIAKKVTKAIVDHKLIEDGDRIMVGLSGGKDSWALIQILDVLRKRAPIDFSLVAVNVDSGYDGSARSHPRRLRRARLGVHVEHTNIGATIDDILDESDDAVLAVRAAAPRRALPAGETVGATKIALGHHLDDFIETLLLNLFFQGSLKAMPARLVSDNGEHVVIRPLGSCTEAEARAYAKEVGLPIIGCCCPACGDLSLQRQRMKRLIARARGRASRRSRTRCFARSATSLTPSARPTAATRCQSSSDSRRADRRGADSAREARGVILTPLRGS